MIRMIQQKIIVPTLRQLASMLPREIAEEALYVQRYGGKPSFIWNARCYDRIGNLKWEEQQIHNLLHDQGEEDILKAFFSQAYTPTASFFIGLEDRITIAEADLLTTLTGEPIVGGYARQTVNTDATDWAVTQDAGDFQAKSIIVTFTPAGANYPTVRNMFLCDVLSGTTGELFASVALSQSRIVLDGDSLDTDITVKLSE